MVDDIIAEATPTTNRYRTVDSREFCGVAIAKVISHRGLRTSSVVFTRFQQGTLAYIRLATGKGTQEGNDTTRDDKGGERRAGKHVQRTVTFCKRF